MTSCCTTRCYQKSVEIPCNWHTPLEKGVTDDPATFFWWESLDDPLLTELIEEAIFRNNDIRLAMIQSRERSLETVNSIAAETAKSYIELRGLQQRLQILQTSLMIQNKIGVLEEGLSKSYISSIDQNESKKNFDVLLVQKSLIELSIKKVIFHLSTLLSYAPGDLYETLDQTCEFPRLPCDIPVGFPMELIERDPAVQYAKKIYITTLNEQAFYNYQKKTLSSLEEAENALAAFFYSSEKIIYLENSKRLKEESYQLIKDLYDQGLKDEREVLTAYQELLIQENALTEGKSEVLINYVNLHKALSIGWKVTCR